MDGNNDGIKVLKKVRGGGTGRGSNFLLLIFLLSPPAIFFLIIHFSSPLHVLSFISIVPTRKGGNEIVWISSR